MSKIMLMMLTITGLLVLSACGQSQEDGHSNGHSNNHDAPETHKQPADTHEGHGKAAPHGPGAYKAAFTFASEAKAGESAALTIEIEDDKGNPVNDFERNHEKLLHLIIVNHDLSYFSHIHPDYKGEGKFTVNTTFPAGGQYKVFADFVPKGGTGATISEWVEVAGEEGEHAALEADAELVKETAGKQIELALSAAEPNEEVTLTFNLRDALTGEGIDTLEPYLGAVGHVVILSSDAEQYIHVHPVDEKSTGPEARFATTFPDSGLYKIWGQFQHNGELLTVPFVVDIR